jgi:competence protein ComEC
MMGNSSFGLLPILAFVLGVWLLQQQASLPNPAWGILFMACLLASWRQRHGWPGRFVMTMCCAGLGFSYAALMAQVRLADELPPRWEGEDILLTGVVASLPQRHEKGVRFRFDVERVATADARVPSRIQLNWYGSDSRPVPDIQPGERWRLTVALKRPHGSLNPHGFDYEAWLLEQDLRATGTVRDEPGNRRLDGFVWRPGYGVDRLRQALALRFDAVLENRPYGGVIKALAIGEQSAIPQGQWAVFTRTGVIHLMSISGLHVTLLAGLGYALAGGLWRRVPRLPLALPAQKAAALAGAVTALAYTLLAGFGIPAQRTLYMLAVVALALWSGRLIPSSRVLALALLVVVLLDPWAVLAPGFWLSFGAVACIFYVAGRGTNAKHWLREAVRVQWAVTLGLLPLLMALFQQVSLVSPFANAFAIPLVSFLVTPLTLLGAILPWDGLLLLAHEVMEAGMSLLEWCAALPQAVWEQHAPPGWTVLLALAGVAWLLAPRGFPARGLGFVPMLPLFSVAPQAMGEGELGMTVLDVGQGLAVVVRTARHALLYDTGPGFTLEADSGNRVIVPYLRGEGVKRLDAMVVSHDDKDHSGGAASVAAAVPVAMLYASLREDHPAHGLARHSLPCHEGQRWEWDGVLFEFLHPAVSARPERRSGNAQSCVLKVTSPHGSVLLPADLEGRAEAELLARRGDGLAASVLVAPHHGGRFSSSPEFVQAVQPALVVFSSGHRNPFGHPRPDVLGRYRAAGSKTLRTDRDGAVAVQLGPQGPRVGLARQDAGRYWLGRDGMQEPGM